MRWAEMQSVVVPFSLRSDPGRCLWQFFPCHIDTPVWCSLGLSYAAAASTVLQRLQFLLCSVHFSLLPTVLHPLYYPGEFGLCSCPGNQTQCSTVRSGGDFTVLLWLYSCQPEGWHFSLPVTRQDICAVPTSPRRALQEQTWQHILTHGKQHLQFQLQPEFCTSFSQLLHGAVFPSGQESISGGRRLLCAPEVLFARLMEKSLEQHRLCLFLWCHWKGQIRTNYLSLWLPALFFASLE